MWWVRACPSTRFSIIYVNIWKLTLSIRFTSINIKFGTFRKCGMLESSFWNFSVLLCFCPLFSFQIKVNQIIQPMSPVSSPKHIHPISYDVSWMKLSLDLKFCTMLYDLFNSRILHSSLQIKNNDVRQNHWSVPTSIHVHLVFVNLGGMSHSGFNFVSLVGFRDENPSPCSLLKIEVKEIFCYCLCFFSFFATEDDHVFVIVIAGWVAISFRWSVGGLFY